MWEKGILVQSPLVGMQNSTVTMENSMEVLWKIKNSTIILSSNLTSEYLSKRIEIWLLKG